MVISADGPLGEGVDVLACGCMLERCIEDGKRTLRFTPCHTDCPNYANLVGSALVEGKPVETREGP